MHLWRLRALETWVTNWSGPIRHLVVSCGLTLSSLELLSKQAAYSWTIVPDLCADPFVGRVLSEPDPYPYIWLRVRL